MRRSIQAALGTVFLLLVMSCGGGGGAGDTPVPQSLSKTSGDNQTAAPGSLVASAVQVIVLDAAGAPVVGAAVTFTVSAGGGSVQCANGRTDAAGHASCATWTLGSASGLNALTASVIGLPPVTFSAKAARTSADVAVLVQSPTDGQTAGDATPIVATVTSTYELATVTASVNGSSVQLAFGPFGARGTDAWVGILSLVGQARGQVGVVVTATDVFANSTDVVIPALLDRAPAVSVSSPLSGALVRPNANVVATCGDDDPAGCTSLTVSLNGLVIAQGKDSLSRSVDFSAYEGRNIGVQFTGTDSVGQQTVVTRDLFVESSPRLIVRAEVSGPVWDVSGTRILFVDVSGPIATLNVRDAAAGTTQTVVATANLLADTAYGYLSATGAIYVHGATTGPVFQLPELYEWRAGTVTSLAALNSEQSLRVAGDWAIYSAAPSVTTPTPITLWSRNLGTGVSAAQTMNAENWLNDVAANGDIVYWTSNSGPLGVNIYRLRGGSVQALTSDSYATLWNTYPVTDGVNVVYRKATPCCDRTTFRIAMHDGSNETILTPTMATEPLPGSGYAVAGGNVAYAVEDIGKALQIWRHSASGEQQLTFFGSSSTIDAIGPDGTVVLTHAPKRYRAVPGAPLQEIGSALGRVIYRDGKFLVLIGQTVLEVGP